jgi:hypothetical protein
MHMSMRSMRVNGLTLAYDVVGEGAPVSMIQGLGGRAAAQLVALRRPHCVRKLVLLELLGAEVAG